MNNLPNEVLIFIFKHLPQKDLLNVVQTCIHYREIIEKHALIRSLQINRRNDESLVPSRIFSIATFATSYQSSLHFKLFETVGRNLTTLKISFCHINLIDIARILVHTRNVKNLSFDYVQLDEDTLHPETELPRLNDVYLEMYESDPMIFRLFVQSTIFKVDIRLYADIPFSNFEHFVKLLDTQKNMYSLSISGAYETNLFLIPMSGAKYQLKEFSITNCDIEEWECLEAYLQEHVKTIEAFAVQDLNWDASNIINQCFNLKKLKNSNGQLNSLQVLPQVNELDWQPSNQGIDKFPNVKHLSIANATQENLESVSRSMTKLEDLQIRFGGIQGLSVPTLKRLKLMSLDGISDDNFFIRHNNIEELIFEYVFNINDDLITDLSRNLRNLKVLKIFGDNQMTSGVFKIIRNNCVQLKVFEMTGWIQKFKKCQWECLHEINGLHIYVEKL